MKFWILLLFTCSQLTASTGLTCNGMDGLCRLPLSKVTLAGTHNSGSGFYGQVRTYEGFPKHDCLFRYQGASFGQQLDNGIRYFDMRTCMNYGVAYACHADNYGGPIFMALEQIDEWLKKNPNEVVVVHFSADYDKRTDVKVLGAELVNEIKRLWNPTSTRLGAKELSVQTNIDATLGKAITTNQRVYVIMHTDLSQNAAPWLFSQENVGSTSTPMSFIESRFCSRLYDQIADKCSSAASKRFIRLDHYVTEGICIRDMAYICNSKIKYTADKCLANANKHGKTVNFLVIDYADDFRGKEVVNVAREENLKNIQFFQ